MKKKLIGLAFILLSTTTSAMNVTTNENVEYQELVNYFFAAARVGDVEVLDTFLSAGFPINQRNKQSYTALMVASYSGQIETTQLLLDNGADVNQTYEGASTLYYVIFHRSEKIFKYLIKKGAEIDKGIKNDKRDFWIKVIADMERDFRGKNKLSKSAKLFFKRLGIQEIK